MLKPCAIDNCIGHRTEHKKANRKLNRFITGTATRHPMELLYSQARFCECMCRFRCATQLNEYNGNIWMRVCVCALAHFNRIPFSWDNLLVGARCTVVHIHNYTLTMRTQTRHRSRILSRKTFCHFSLPSSRSTFVYVQCGCGMWV